MIEKLPFNPELIAPCSMNCTICRSYFLSKCAGCRIRNKKCAFIKKRCADQFKLLKGELNYCFELIQNHRYQCPECGHMISVHDQKCLYCGKKYLEESKT
jgi:hypothetical protein